MKEAAYIGAVPGRSGGEAAEDFLRICIVSHPGSPHRGYFFDWAHHTLCKDSTHLPFGRGLGIPVYDFPEVPGKQEALSSLTARVEKLFIIILLDALLLQDEDLCKFCARLGEETRKNPAGVSLLPVALTSESEINARNPLPEIEYLSLWENKEGENLQNNVLLKNQFLVNLLHNIGRFMDQEVSPAGGQFPIKLFISYKSDDEGELALAIDKRIKEAYQALGTYLYVVRSAPGTNILTKIDREVKDSVLLIIHSDRYSTSRYCQREVRLAKSLLKPIVVINRYVNGEERSFPYMFNVPHLHYSSHESDDVFLDKVILHLLYEIVRHLYLKNSLHYEAGRLQQLGSDVGILATAPELLVFPVLKKQLYTTVIYPEPKLTAEEIEILQAMDHGIRFITLKELISD